MAIAYDNYGTYGEGTTSISAAYPASISAGNLLILSVVSKYPANPPSDPSGWTLIGSVSGGAGASGVDTGEVLVTAWYKVAVGTESGNVTVTITGGNSAVGVIVKFSNGTGSWGVAAASGTDTTADTTWSVTATSDPGVTAGDMVYCVSGINSNAYGWASESLAQTGITWGTQSEIGEVATSQGNDLDTVYSHHTANAGTGSAAPVYTATAGGSATYAPCGGTLFIRLRETTAGVSGSLAVTLGAMTASGTGTVAIAGTLSASLAAMTASATGTVAITGVLDASLAAMTAAGTGTVAITGTLSATLGTMTAGATGTVAITGALDATLGAMTLSATGEVATVTGISGTLNVTLGEMTASGAGTVAVQGQASITLGAMTASGAGAVTITGVLNSVLGAMEVTAAGTVAITGTLNATLGTMTLSATGTYQSVRMIHLRADIQRSLEPAGQIVTSVDITSPLVREKEYTEIVFSGQIERQIDLNSVLQRSTEVYSTVQRNLEVLAIMEV